MGKKLIGLGLISFCFLWVVTTLSAEMVSQEARIAKASGKVECLKNDKADWESAAAEVNLLPGEKIRTDKKSMAELSLPDGSSITLSESTEISIINLSEDNSTKIRDYLLNLTAGKIKIVMGQQFLKDSNFRVITPSGTVKVLEVLGSSLTIAFNPDGTLNVGSDQVIADISNDEFGMHVILENGDEALIQVDASGNLIVTAVRGNFDVTGPDGTTITVAEGGSASFNSEGGAAGYTPPETGFGDPPLGDALGETPSGS